MVYRMFLLGRKFVSGPCTQKPKTWKPITKTSSKTIFQVWVLVIYCWMLYVTKFVICFDLEVGSRIKLYRKRSQAHITSISLTLCRHLSQWLANWRWALVWLAGGQVSVCGVLAGLESRYENPWASPRKQESPANAKGTRDSSACMKALCEQM